MGRTVTARMLDRGEPYGLKHKRELMKLTRFLAGKLPGLRRTAAKGPDKNHSVAKTCQIHSATNTELGNV